MNRSSWIGMGLICCFVLPVFLAYRYHAAILKGSSVLKTTAHGLLLKPGTKFDFNDVSDRWTLVILKPKNCSQRCELWLNELPYFPVVLSKYDFKTQVFSLNDLPLQNELLNQITWDIHEDGSVLFVDKRGYVALAYPFAANPKKAFLDVKKLLATTH
jgi:cytochrome oxidase Cu insertion factor (SCO1/SenC/PrrC family)